VEVWLHLFFDSQDFLIRKCRETYISVLLHFPFANFPLTCFWVPCSWYWKFWNAIAN